MKYINKVKQVVLRIASNIKYLLCVNMSELNKNELETQTMLFNRVNKIYDNIDVENIEDKVYDMDSRLDDKVDEYQIQDVLHDTFGYSEDYINYDDMNDIKEDIKKLQDEINDNIMNKKILDDSIDNLVKKDILINECINEIVFRIQPNPRVSLNYDNDNV